MKENFEFIGRNYSGSEKNDLKDSLQKWSEESSLLIEGESPKTLEQVKMIETADSLLKEEFKLLGIESYHPIEQDKMHILSKEVFKKKFPNFSGSGFFRAVDDSIYINNELMKTKARLFASILHESIHRASIQKFYEDTEGSVTDARVGYRLNSTWKKEASRQKRFRGLNEIMNEYTAYMMLLGNLDLLEKKLGITKEDIQGPLYAYMDYGPILFTIVKKIAEDTSSPAEEVFRSFERAQFEGSIVALKKVEKSFGKDSVEVLSYLGELKDEQKCKELDQMIKSYFEATKDDVKGNFAHKIKEFYKNEISNSNKIKEIDSD